MAYRILPAALRDLDDILSWYRDEASTSIAREMRNRFHETFRRISRPPFPLLRRVELIGDPYRFVLMDPYWIVCAPSGARTLRIVRVLHARRDLDRLLKALR